MSAMFSFPVFPQNAIEKCRVIDDTRVEYEGNTCRLSRLATTLLQSRTIVQGALYFTYEGELLTDHRDRLESEEETIERKNSDCGDVLIFIGFCQKITIHTNAVTVTA